MGPWGVRFRPVDVTGTYRDLSRTAPLQRLTAAVQVRPWPSSSQSLTAPQESVPFCSNSILKGCQGLPLQEWNSAGGRLIFKGSSSRSLALEAIKSEVSTCVVISVE